MVLTDLQVKMILTLFFMYSTGLFVICFLIYKRTLNIEKLSGHKGLFFFNKTFLFLALAKLTYGPMKILRFTSHNGFFYHELITFFCYFFLNLGSFFFVFCLFHKKFDFKKYYITIFFITLSAAFAYHDLYIAKNPIFLFLVQIVFLAMGSLKAYFNVRENKSKHGFDKLILIAMVVLLVSWILNFFLYINLSRSIILVLSTLGLTTSSFIIYLRKVTKITRGLVNG